MNGALVRPRARFCRAAFAMGLLIALGGCTSTLDSLGTDPEAVGTIDGGPSTLTPLVGPASYGNAFRDLAGKSDADISAKLAAAFAQLFHGDPSTQAIYVQVGTDQAKITDVLHGDVRSEGIGTCMIVAVELDKRDEFDRLWAYAKASLEQTSGPGQGYFNSVCDDTTPCLDPYGMEQFVTALIFAHDRWDPSGATSYASEALALLDLLQNKQQENGGASSSIISVFDPTTALVREQPTPANAGYTRSALEIPPFYELWAEATGNAFWTSAAAAARAHLAATANASTGLWPMRSYFDGSPVPNFDTFLPQGYRTELNLALDALWGKAPSTEGMEADRVLGFFTIQGINSTGKTYELDGTVVDATHEFGLTATNGALAVASSRTNRADFVNSVWNMAIPSGDPRYYDGILYLVSLLVLSGQYRVY
jgi:oligosaccharide reducing-end xylanase